jgi:hypothetical protein
MEMKQSESVAMTSPVRTTLKAKPEEGSSATPGPVQMDTEGRSEGPARSEEDKDAFNEYMCDNV